MCRSSQNWSIRRTLSSTWQPQSAFESEAAEREDFDKCIAASLKATGQRPLGFFSRGSESLWTRKILRDLDFTYASNGLDDDVDFVSKEFAALVRGGMTPLDALRAETINGAELLGKSKDFGSIEVGKYADIVGVEGDPLADISVMEKVVFVMKGGEVHKAAVK